MGEKGYHHGDLEAELIDKGLQLLAREGYEGFSMRKLAALCGVSHAAPYKHFKGREEIIRAISQRISAEFTDALQQAAGLHPGDTRMQIIDLCVQYVAFMVEHPDYFRFVFMTTHNKPIKLDAHGVEPGHREPMAVAWQHAKQHFEPLHGGEWQTRFMALWCQAHGLTLMLVCGTIQPDCDYRDLAKSMLEHSL